MGGSRGVIVIDGTVETNQIWAPANRGHFRFAAGRFAKPFCNWSCINFCCCLFASI